MADRDGAPLYRRLCQGVATEATILDLVARAPAAQRRPNLLLAAVHYLLLGGADDQLGSHYATVAEWRGTKHEPADSDPFDDMVAFCARHREELAELLATRSTQTNEVGRCSVVLPALATVAQRVGAPLSLLDLGSAAGLNLLFDRYAYAYHRAGFDSSAVTRAGVPDSPVELETQVRHGRLPDLTLPPVAHRMGIDHHPVDPDDRDGSLWLLACQWPDHLERFRRTARALEVARATADRPPVRTGDMVDDLAVAAGAAPAGTHLCVMHTWAAAYLHPADQGRLTLAMASVAVERPVSWLFAEHPDEVPGLDVPAAPGGREDREATALVLVEMEGTERRATRLADVHPHGRWIRWWDKGDHPPVGPTG